MSETALLKNSQYYIDLENQHGAHNYHPLPVVLEKGEGVMFGMSKEKNTMIFFLLILRSIKVILIQKF